MRISEQRDTCSVELSLSKNLIYISISFLLAIRMSFREHIKKLKEQPETAAAGNRWTPEEETQLIDALGNNKDVEDIAKDHKRTPGGIRSRMREIAVRMIETDGKSIEEVSDILFRKIA
jgi:hypothetical protein